MKISAAFFRRLQWINLPTVALVALLQRTPVLRVFATAGDFVQRAPASALLKSAFATAASLGAVHSLAGATQLSLSPSQNPGAATVGAAKTILITVVGAQVPPGSWTVGGNAPAGMTFSAFGSSEAGITSGTINASTIQFAGTPTVPGNFTVTLKAWQEANGTGDFIDYTYTINVAAAADTAPVFTTQPANQSAPIGGAVVFFVVAAGSPTPTYQWRKNNAVISGQTSSSLTLSNLTTADAGSYTCVATNSFGAATSNTATLNVTGGVAAPSITTQPLSLSVAAGQTVGLAVGASGAGLSYQWKRANGVPVLNGAGPLLILPGVTSADGDRYFCTVTTSGGGSANSESATVSVGGSGQVTRLSNLSVRASLTNAPSLIVGFSTTGPKDLLVRGVGPKLADFGIPNFFADPRLELYDGARVLVAENDDWPANLAPLFSSLGAFALNPSSKDAALVSSVTGGYTTQLKGTGNGVVLVEVYDAGFGFSPRLNNVSARNFVGTGANILIAGFTVDGPVAKTLLIRGIGPKLASFGVGGTLVDPKLELYRENTKLAENDNWNASTGTYFGGAFALDAGSKDAALIITLPPGGYTAQISGADGGTGEALVEIYEVP